MYVAHKTGNKVTAPETHWVWWAEFSATRFRQPAKKQSRLYKAPGGYSECFEEAVITELAQIFPTVGGIKSSKDR